MWTFTAVVLVAGLQYAFAEATVERPVVASVGTALGVGGAHRQASVAGPGRWCLMDPNLVREPGDSPKAMILCWWHLRKRCYEQMSSAGGPKDRRRAFEKELLGQLWEGRVNAAIELLKGTLEWVRNPTAVEELIT